MNYLLFHKENIFNKIYFNNEIVHEINNLFLNDIFKFSSRRSIWETLR